MEPDSPNLQKQGLSIGTANLLKGVEKSYDKGRYLLDESVDSGFIDRDDLEITDDIKFRAPNAVGGMRQEVEEKSFDVYRSQGQLLNSLFKVLHNVNCQIYKSSKGSL